MPQYNPKPQWFKAPQAPKPVERSLRRVIQTGQGLSKRYSKRLATKPRGNRNKHGRTYATASRGD